MRRCLPGAGITLKKREGVRGTSRVIGLFYFLGDGQEEPMDKERKDWNI